VHHELLLVFAVGETPTTGVRKLALSSAFEQIEELSSLRSGGLVTAVNCGGDEKEEYLCVNVGLLGPYFTGSALSLSIVFESFETWLRGAKSNRAVSDLTDLQFEMISGSAEAIDPEAFSDKPFTKHKADDATPLSFNDPPYSATVGYAPLVNWTPSWAISRLNGAFRRLVLRYCGNRTPISAKCLILRNWCVATFSNS
jgi:hypothetical protein